MREGTLGNSSHRLLMQLRENHSEEWLHSLNQYLAEWAAFVKPSLLPVVFQEPPEPLSIPTEVASYSVWEGHYEPDCHIKASITCTFGTILKKNVILLLRQNNLYFKIVSSIYI